MGESIARLRPLPGVRAATDLAGLLFRQGRFAEAVDVLPDVAAQREGEQRFWTGWEERKKAAAGGDEGRSEESSF
ncbi:hypothetical protein ACFU7Y_07000 [Kitasatospora sp. NPDC057542]|uniref:hypothetical protein n=1 Tax=Streptomycetaceae TaxID=2062 RepID=UPI001CCFCF20|nr:hypothetical protein [Streptomyces sp. LS1784]